VAFGTPRNDYACGDVGQKLREANERTLVIALIETAAGIAGCQGESRGSISAGSAIFDLPVGFDEAWLRDGKKPKLIVNEFFWAVRLDRTPFLLFSQKGGFQNGRLPDNRRIS
jgi:hypothetical protein